MREITADKKLTFFGRIYWLIATYINGRRKDNSELKVYSTSSFFPINNASFDVCLPEFTPSRCISNILLENINWCKLESLLCGKINVLDIGCGSGLYAEFFQRALDTDFHYTGLDINSNTNWSILESENIKFLEVNAELVENYYENHNLIFSHSALEHISDYRTVVSKINDMASMQKKKIIHIHIVPGPGAFLNYLWHGYRHYNLATLAETFPKNKGFNSFVFELGARESNRVHRYYITRRLVLSRIFSRYKTEKHLLLDDKDYIFARNRAILADSYCHPVLKKSNFLAIFSANFDLSPNNIFDSN